MCRKRKTAKCKIQVKKHEAEHKINVTIYHKIGKNTKKKETIKIHEYKMLLVFILVNWSMLQDDGVEKVIIKI